MTATTSARRQALADLARARKGEQASGGRFRTALIAVAIFALLAFLVLWLAGFFSTPVEVLALREAVNTQVVELERMARGEIPYSEERASWGPLYEAAQQVPETYRDQEIGRFFRAREAAEINSYFALPPDQRAAEMDRRIKAEVARRARWEAERAQREASQAAQTSSNGGGGVGTAPTGQATSGGRRRGSRTEETRNAWVKRYIDRTSADGRAKRTEYRRAKDQRRIAMGLEPGRR
jgi:hypothetical protein